MPKYKPTKPRDPGPIALVIGGTAGAFVTEKGLTEANGEKLAQLIASWPGRVFSLSTTRGIAETVGLSRCEVAKSAGRTMFVKVLGKRIISTRKLLGDLEPGAALATLVLVDSWLAGEGVNLSGIGWTAEKLWRSKLPETGVGFFSPTRWRATYGGRKQATAGSYGESHYVDIKAAYPAAMRGPFPTVMKSLGQLDEWQDHQNGIGLATVTIPQSLEGIEPLPLSGLDSRPIKWEPGTARGWYTFDDLRAGVDGRADVQIERAYVGSRNRIVFDRFVDDVMTGRALPDHAGQIGKAIAAALWGTFSMGGNVTVWRWKTDDPRSAYRVRNYFQKTGTAAYIAAIVQGRVRGQVARDLIPCNPFYIDTDGGIIPAGNPLPETGDGIGEWSVRDSYQTVDVRGPGAYKTTSYDDRVSVTMSGVSGATEADLRSGRGYGDGTLTGGRTHAAAVKASKQPFLWTGEGVPVHASRFRFDPATVPAGWSWTPPELAGLPDAPKYLGPPLGTG